MSLIADPAAKGFQRSSLFLLLQFPFSHCFGFFCRYPFLPPGFPLPFLNFHCQSLKGILKVLVLGTLSAPDDHDPRRAMLKPHSGVGDVPVLSPRAGSTESGDVTFGFEFFKVHFFKYAVRSTQDA